MKDQSNQPHLYMPFYKIPQPSNFLKLERNQFIFFTSRKTQVISCIINPLIGCRLISYLEALDQLMDMKRDILQLECMQLTALLQPW